MKPAAWLMSRQSGELKLHNFQASISHRHFEMLQGPSACSTGGATVKRMPAAFRTLRGIGKSTTHPCQATTDGCTMMDGPPDGMPHQPMVDCRFSCQTTTTCLKLTPSRLAQLDPIKTSVTSRPKILESLETSELPRNGQLETRDGTGISSK